MDFEEFFKKKRIDLNALQTAEPGLFSEFKTHFEQMGEKSFDHTKKYWFNKLRLQYHLVVEPKTEKVKIDNPLAEQTITESLIEQTVAKPKLGFTPKFRAAAAPKPADEVAGQEPAGTTQAEHLPAPPKPGFTPRFKAANMPKPAAEPAPEIRTEEPAATPSAPKPGFTPRFKAANMPKPAAEPAPEAKPTEPVATPAPKLGFTPKFKAANMPKPAAEPAPETKPEEPATTPAPKLGFTPKFKAANMPKPAANNPEQAQGGNPEKQAPSDDSGTNTDL